jgi:type I restriction enzyme M protein
MLHEFDALIRKVHDYLYANSSIKTPEALQSEVAKIVIVLVAESNRLTTERPLFNEQEYEWLVKSYESLRKKYKAWDWGKFELDKKNTEWVLRTISQIDFSKQERDFLGDALEVMRSTDAKRLGGQFFTDQRVTNLTMNLIGYDPKKHDFIDFCSGTGGFLIPAFKKKIKGAAKAIYGVEMDSKIYKLAQSTISHFDEFNISRIFNADSLLNPIKWDSKMKIDLKPDSHDRLASNPPFGTKIKIRDLEILNQYELAFRWRETKLGWVKSKELTARAPEILFIERNLQFAKKGSGVIGLILPYQILSGPQLGWVRQWLLTNSQLLAVIDLPGDTFQPWTGTKASIVIFKRRKKPISNISEIKDDPEIFMSVSSQIGHDRRGNPIYNDLGEIKQDLTKIADAFRLFASNKSFKNIHLESFTLKPAEILSNYGLRINAAHYLPSSSKILDNFINIDNKNFESVKIKDVVERIFCPGRFKRNYEESAGIPFLGGSNISQYLVKTDKFLSTESPNIDDFIVKRDWILVTRSGSTGIISRVPKNWEGFAISEHVIRIVPKKGMDFEANYIEIFLRSKWGQDLLTKGIFGSVIDEITPEYIGDLPLPIPRDRGSLSRLSGYMDDVLTYRSDITSKLNLANEELENLINKII